MEILWIALGVVLLFALYLWSLYNSLVKERMEIDEAFSQIDVQLKRRTDLIPNLVESVKGYAKHEKTVFSEVTKARSAMMGASTPAKMAAASDMLTGALGKLIAVAEAYPQLRANENFVQLQKELSDTEDKVAYSRQYYNSQVQEYNLKVAVFPANMIAGNFGFAKRDFFATKESEREATKVKFE